MMEAKVLNPKFDDLTNPEVLKSHIHRISEALKDEPKTVDLGSVLSSLRIDPAEELKPPKIAWEQVNEAGSVPLGTLGNFSLIIGKAKSRKSFFINIAVSTVLQAGTLLNQFKGCLPHDKRKVLYFDTEQGKYHVQLALKRICKQIGEDVPKDLDVFYLRSKTPKERLELIDYAINNTENVGFVIIDGIKDLVTSINDEAEATMIASKLLKWTEEKGIHIVTVLHQNKSDNNARGHIGTELINKAETVLSVSKNEMDKDISIVQAEMCRNREPETFAFEINDDGIPIIAENYELRTETKKNKFDITELENIEIFSLLNIVFSKGEEFSYSELRIQMKLAFKEKYKKDVGDNRIKELITDCKNKGYLLQEADRKPYKQGRFNDSDDDF